MLFTGAVAAIMLDTCTYACVCVWVRKKSMGGDRWYSHPRAAHFMDVKSSGCDKQHFVCFRFFHDDDKRDNQEKKKSNKKLRKLLTDRLLCALHHSNFLRRTYTNRLAATTATVEMAPAATFTLLATEEGVGVGTFTSLLEPVDDDAVSSDEEDPSSSPLASSRLASDELDSSTNAPSSKLPLAAVTPVEPGFWLAGGVSEPAVDEAEAGAVTTGMPATSLAPSVPGAGPSAGVGDGVSCAHTLGVETARSAAAAANTSDWHFILIRS